MYFLLHVQNYLDNCEHKFENNGLLLYSSNNDWQKHTNAKVVINFFLHSVE
jgi:hypothetical protein